MSLSQSAENEVALQTEFDQAVYDALQLSIDPMVMLQRSLNAVGPTTTDTDTTDRGGEIA